MNGFSEQKPIEKKNKKGGKTYSPFEVRE